MNENTKPYIITAGILAAAVIAGGIAFSGSTNAVALDAGVPLGCLRRPAGAICNRVDGGNPGNWNRYPAEELTGPGCEAVACTVMAGDDPDPEDGR